MKVFPIFLNNLHVQRTVVIGGDEHEAERKVGQLLKADAQVTVISPDVSPGLRQWADEGAVEWLQRDYREGDLAGATLAFVTEVNPERTAPIYAEAQRENVLICAMDDIPHCTFVNGSTIQREPLTISISTSGCAPVLAVRLRQQLEETIGSEHIAFLEMSRALREPMATHHTDAKDRKRLWYELVDSDVLDLLRAGNVTGAYRRTADILGEPVAADAGLLTHQ